MVDENPFHLIGAFPGPVSTEIHTVQSAYAISRTHLTTEDIMRLYVYSTICLANEAKGDKDITIPDSYPFQPVKMKFIT